MPRSILVTTSAKGAVCRFPSSEHGPACGEDATRLFFRQYQNGLDGSPRVELYLACAEHAPSDGFEILTPRPTEELAQVVARALAPLVRSIADALGEAAQDVQTTRRETLLRFSDMLDLAAGLLQQDADGHRLPWDPEVA